MSELVEHIAVSDSIAGIVFGGKTDSISVVKMASRRNVCDGSLELWHAVRLSDLSSIRIFVACSYEPHSVYEVNFFSRNDVPKLPSAIPDDLPSWGIIRGASILVTDMTKFCLRMVADVFVAVPTYRFEFLADDVEDAIETVNPSGRPLERALTSMVSGYSFRRYDIATQKPSGEFSIISGVLE